VRAYNVHFSYTFVTSFFLSRKLFFRPPLGRCTSDRVRMRLADSSPDDTQKVFRQKSRRGFRRLGECLNVDRYFLRATLLRAPAFFADDLPPVEELFLADERPPPDDPFPLVLADERDRDDVEPDEVRLPDALLLPRLADELLPDDDRDELLFLPPLESELELRDDDEVDLPRPDDDREPDDRLLLVDVERRDGAIVSAAAPTAPTAAPAAAPVSISPATSITLLTNCEFDERRDRDELPFDEPELFLDPDEEDLLDAIFFLP